MRRQPDLTVNSLRLPLPVGGVITQEYAEMGGKALLRFANGAGLLQTAWTKLRTSISGTGAFPLGLDGVDWSAPVTLGCVAPRSIQSASNVITVPAARRTDAAPYGFAITADNARLLPTPVAIAGNTATLTAVAGALGYQVYWYPLLTVLAPEGLSATWDAAGAVATWQIVAEEQ